MHADSAANEERALAERPLPGYTRPGFPLPLKPLADLPAGAYGTIIVATVATRAGQ